MWHEIVTLEEEQKMPYITSWERMGIAKGKAEGIIEGQRALLRRVAMLRFGNVPDQLEQRIAGADQDALG